MVFLSNYTTHHIWATRILSKHFALCRPDQKRLRMPISVEQWRACVGKCSCYHLLRVGRKKEQKQTLVQLLWLPFSIFCQGITGTELAITINRYQWTPLAFLAGP